MEIFPLENLIVSIESIENHLILLFFIDLSEETTDDRAINSQPMPGIIHFEEIFFLSFALIIDPLINARIVYFEDEMSTCYSVA